jgi:hypothetical protein
MVYAFEAYVAVNVQLASVAVHVPENDIIPVELFTVAVTPVLTAVPLYTTPLVSRVVPLYNLIWLLVNTAPVPSAAVANTSLDLSRLITIPGLPSAPSSPAYPVLKILAVVQFTVLVATVARAFRFTLASHSV